MPSADHVEAVQANIKAAEDHVRSEYVRDLAGTMATVGVRPHYALTAQPRVVGVISGRDGVAAFYEMAHKVAIPQASRFVSQIATDWYMFVENVPTRTWVADGSLRTAHTATLFVTASDGLTGEFVWERPPVDPVAKDAGSLPLGAVRSVTLHEALLAAIGDGDGTALAGLLTPNCTWAERDYLGDAEGGEILELRGESAASDHLLRWHERYRPERVSVLNRQATDWYVFAEELWIVRDAGGQRRQFRKAVIYAVDAAGRIESAVGFGTDLEQASALADLSLGQAFWPASAGSQRTRAPSPL